MLSEFIIILLFFQNVIITESQNATNDSLIYGKIGRSIVGQEAQPASWEFLARIVLNAFDGATDYFCEGAGYSENIVLTLANCVGSVIKKKRYEIKYTLTVRIGANLINYLERKPKAIYVHPDFSFVTRENNLAVILLDKPAQFVPLTIGIPNENSSVELKAASWENDAQHRLIHMYFKEVEDKKCKTYFNNSNVENYYCMAPPPDTNYCINKLGAPIVEDPNIGVGLLTQITNNCSKPNSKDPSKVIKLSPYKEWIDSINQNITEASENWQFLVEIYNDEYFLCMGALVSVKSVITNGICVTSPELDIYKPEKVTLRIGWYNDKFTVQKRAFRILRHMLYNMAVIFFSSIEENISFYLDFIKISKGRPKTDIECIVPYYLPHSRKLFEVKVNISEKCVSPQSDIEICAQNTCIPKTGMILTCNGELVGILNRNKNGHCQELTKVFPTYFMTVSVFSNWIKDMETVKSISAHRKFRTKMEQRKKLHGGRKLPRDFKIKSVMDHIARFSRTISENEEKKQSAMNQITNMARRLKRKQRSKSTGDMLTMNNLITLFFCFIMFMK